MPGLGERTAAATGAVITPNRATDFAFDLDEVVQVEPPWSFRRYGNEIVPDPTSVVGQFDVEMLASGYWIERPLQDQLNRLHERTETNSTVMLLSQFELAPDIVQEPLYRTPTELTGLTTGAAAGLALFNNDLFFGYRRAAGAMWNAPLTTVSRVKPTQETENIVLDRAMEAKVDHLEDQAYLLRFHLAGTHRHAPDNLLTFYFGGPLFAEGYGEYALTFHGHGGCTLREYAGGQWVNRDEWQWTTPHQVMDAAHTMRIIPHVRRYIEFKSETNRLFTPTLYLAPRPGIGPWAAPQGSPTVQLYTVNPSVTGQPSLNPNWVTGKGRVKVDVRRDLRAYWQVARLEYPPGGILVDMPFVIPWGMDNAVPLIARADGFKVLRMASGDNGEVLADIVMTVFDVQTGLPLPAHGSGTGLQLPGDENQLNVGFNFSSVDGTRTAFLRGWNVERAGQQATKVIGLTLGGQLTEVSITGPSADPTHETASLTIEDTKNELNELRERGGMNCRVQTQYDAGDPTLKSVLFYGRVTRADANLIGPDVGQTYPAPGWRRLDVQLVGEWQRLADQLMIGQFDFTSDRAAPQSEWIAGTPPAWKIGDAVKEMIRAAGYPDNQIDVSQIPDGLRLPISTEDSQNYYPLPFTSIGDYVQRVLRDYLGAYLIWDANAENGGFRGMWRVRLGPVIAAGATPLWEFVNDEPPPAAGPAGTRTLTFRSEAFGANKSPVRRGSFHSYVSPPEANAVIVTTTGALLPSKANTGVVQSLINYRSYNPPGHTPDLAVPGPTNPDYLGRFIPLVLTDAGLATGDTPEKRQAAVDLVARRLYNIACRATKHASWEAELVLITDPTDTFQTRKRPLQYGDFVRVDGIDHLVRSCNPSYSRDHLQMAHYEAEVYRAPD